MWYSVAFLVMVALFVIHIAHTYTVTYMLAPFLILGIGIALNKIKWRMDWLKTLGKYSLEIYITNCIVMRLVSYEWMVIPSIMYWVLLSSLTPAMIYINKLFLPKR